MAGKPVITATQMLASMERNPKPTRAEASDVANAILDGSSAIMLSGETAAGKYPVEAVKALNSLALTTESCLDEYGYLQKIPFHSANVVTETISGAVKSMAQDLEAAAIICLTESGFTEAPSQVPYYRDHGLGTCSPPPVHELGCGCGVVHRRVRRRGPDPVRLGLRPGDGFRNRRGFHHRHGRPGATQWWYGYDPGAYTLTLTQHQTGRFFGPSELST